MLLQQIEAYLPLARKHNGNAADLEPAIIDYSLSLVSDLNPGMDMSHLSDEIRHDADLNAQGLAAWYQRETQ